MIGLTQKTKKESIKNVFEPMVHGVIKEIGNDLLGIEISPEVAVIFEEFDNIEFITDNDEIKKYGAPKVNEYRYKINFDGLSKNYNVRVFINKRDNYEHVRFITPKNPKIIKVNLNEEFKSVNSISETDMFKSLSNQIRAIQTIINDGKTNEEIGVNVKRYFKIINGVDFLNVHHLKSKTSEHAIMDVVKTNEIEEFAATFPERREEIFKLHEGYTKLISDLEGVWDVLKDKRPKNITPKEKKRYAMEVFKEIDSRGLKEFSGLYFGLNDGKVESVKEFMMKYDNKRLYKSL